MSESEERPSQIGDLRREWNKHPVIRVAGAYLVGAWLILQVAEVILPSYDVPGYVMQLLIAVLVGLLPLVLLAARFKRIHRLFAAEEGLGGATRGIPAPTEAVQAPEPLSTLDLPIELSERRRVTTVVCSLTGMRGDRRDPEVAMGVIPALKDELDSIIGRYKGLRLISSRNQIIVTFGFPRLHEDDALRAAKASNEILDLLATQATSPAGTSLFYSAGIHTDTIIVDDDGDDSDELALLGDNTATIEWLRARAPAGSIVISAETAKLLSGLFALTEISRDSHPALGQDMPIYQLGEQLSGQWQQIMGELSEFLGREYEYQLLLDKWQSVLEGETQFVFLNGEAGIGKSSLLYHAVRDIMVRDAPSLLLMNCESYFSNSPFRPIISYLETIVFGDDLDLSQASRADKLRQFLADLDFEHANALPLLGSLLSIQSDDPDMQLDGSGRLVREKMISCLIGILQALAASRPVLLVVEDLHWADPSTIELLDNLLSEIPEHRIYGLLSSRPGFDSRWNNRSQLFNMQLGKLSDRVAETLVRHRFGAHEVPDWLVAQLVTTSGGIPFYLDELVRGLLDKGDELVTAKPGSLDIPLSLHASLDSRVDKLGDAKHLLQLCSVIGQEFSYDLLLDVVGKDNEQALLNAVVDLVSEGLLYQKGVAPEAIFRFKHRLIMESAYQSLLIKTRSELHGAIARHLEASFPERCQSAPGRVAEHFDQAGNARKAIEYRILAARRAYRSFSNDEAMAQVAFGEKLLARLDDNVSGDGYEFTLNNLKGMIALASHGYTNPEVRIAFERAIELSESMDRSEELFSTIVGMWMYYLIRADYGKATELAQRLYNMALESGSEPELLQANYGMGYSMYFCSDLEETLGYFQQAVKLDQPDRDYTRQTPSQDDSRVHAYCMLALALWLRGDAENSRIAVERAFQIATSTHNPYATMWAHYQCAFLSHMRGDVQKMSVHASAMHDIAVEKGFSFFMPLAEFFRAMLIEEPASRLAALNSSYAKIVAAGARSSTSYFKSIIVEELIGQQDLEAANALLEEAFDFIKTRHEELFMPECMRLRATLLIKSKENTNAEPAKSILRQAIDTARGMNNVPYALKNALCYYTVDDGSEEARALLAEILLCYKSEDTSADYVRACKIVNRRLSES